VESLGEADEPEETPRRAEAPRGRTAKSSRHTRRGAE